MTAVARNQDEVAEEEAGLWRSLAERSPGAREALFAHYAGFARQIAGRLYRRAAFGDLELQELRQLAYAGLLESIDRFDPARGVPFRGYAGRRISGSVLDGLSHATERREQVTYRNRIRAERLRSLADDTVASEGVGEAMRALAELATGLAIGFLLESGMMASDVTPDRAPNAYDSLAWRESVEGLVAALDDLPERERLVIRQHYLEGVPFELIAELLKLSKGRISQIHKQAIGRLRRRLVTSNPFRLEQ